MILSRTMEAYMMPLYITILKSRLLVIKYLLTWGHYVQAYPFTVKVFFYYRKSQLNTNLYLIQQLSCTQTRSDK